MSTVKQPHIVPQCYLEKFAEKERIFVFDKLLGKSYRSTISKIAREGKFYDFPQTLQEQLKNDGLPTQPFEKFLGSYEGQYPNIFNQLFQNIVETGTISNEVKRSISNFMIVQFLRSKNSRQKAVSLSEGTMNLANKVRGQNDFKFKLKQEFEALEHWSDFNLETIETRSRHLDNYVWILLVNNSKNKFYTSDNPFSLSNLKGNPIGLANIGSEIYFPITTDHALLLIEKSTNLNLPSGIRKTDNIDYYNHRQIIASDRFLYCEEDDFKLAKEIIQKHPDLKTMEYKKLVID